MNDAQPPLREAASLRSIKAFRMTSANPELLSEFYAGIGFAIGEPYRISSEELALLGLGGRGMRTPMMLGKQRVDLDGFDRQGRPYPAGADAASLVFQHLAIVTSDAEAAGARAKKAGATPISRGGTITLPPSAGGVTAVKFRDPEGHPLEFLQFPDNHDGEWRGSGMLGIDHSAISISDLDRSEHFYQAHGLRRRQPTLNQGSTQEALDGLDDVRVDVLPMMPSEKPPHLELLHYRRPAGAGAGTLEVNDVAATRVAWDADRAMLVSDPDGHFHQFEQQTES